MRGWQVISVLCMCWLAGLAHAEGATFETTLDNGLRVIVREDRRAPTVVHMVWYRIGGMEEGPGQSGIAHVLEHMMFKGTPVYGAGVFNRKVAAAGGIDNATTTRDATAYYQQIPKEQLLTMMTLEADRMRHLTLDPADFRQELKVVLEERRQRTDDDPHGKLFEQLNASALQVHPYRRPVIGWPGDLERLKVEDLRIFYRRWMVPGNALVVVVGDVDHAEVFRQAAATYGGVPARVLPPRPSLAEPPQTRLRRVVVRAPADLPLLAFAYRVPVLRQADDREPYALEMLAAILDGYEGARLSRRLVREARVAVSVTAEYDAVQRGEGLFYLMALPVPGQTPAALEQAMREEIGRLCREGVSEAELIRARAQLLASQVYQRDSMFEQAMEIGTLETAGLRWKEAPHLLAALQAVTAEDILAVARKYLRDDGLTIGLLEPEALPKPVGKEKRR